MDFIDRSPALAALNYSKGQVLYRLGLRGHYSGSTAAAVSVNEAVDYIRNVADDYIRYGASNDPVRVSRKHILEVGPGDNLGVALRLLSLGAASVTCVDAFEPVTDTKHNALVYSALWQSLSDQERSRLEDVVSVGEDHRVTLRADGRLRVHYSAPIGSTQHLRPDSFDLVISRAVLEHIDDLGRGWSRMHRSLKPDGEMWHVVDFRSHKMFDRIHALYFLTFREPIWRLISSPDPTLNRCRLPAYRKLLSENFQTWKIYATRILNGPPLSPFVEQLVPGRHYSAQDLERVRQIRPLLKPPFSNHADEELLISGVFVVGQKKL
jgi:SAM-dependent methyltransferase